MEADRLKYESDKALPTKWLVWALTLPLSWSLWMVYAHIVSKNGEEGKKQEGTTMSDSKLLADHL